MQRCAAVRTLLNLPKDLLFVSCLCFDVAEGGRMFLYLSKNEMSLLTTRYRSDSRRYLLVLCYRCQSSARHVFSSIFVTHTTQASNHWNPNAPHSPWATPRPLFHPPRSFPSQNLTPSILKTTNLKSRTNLNAFPVERLQYTRTRRQEMFGHHPCGSYGGQVLIRRQCWALLLRHISSSFCILYG